MSLLFTLPSFFPNRLAPYSLPAPRYALPQTTWCSQHEAVTGLTHRDHDQPCQDAALASHQPRPVVIVADGAGSAAASELGSRAVTRGLARLLQTLERQVSALLDTPDPDPAVLAHFPLLVIKHALGILEDSAAEHRRDSRDLRCTLLLIVAGKERLLWLKVGDGALVLERLQAQAFHPLQPLKSVLSVVGGMGKGQFANQTTFLNPSLRPDDVQHGIESASYVTGIAAMSDGSADRLVSHDNHRVASRLSVWFDQLRHRKLRRRALTSAFYAPEFTQGTTGDDCSLALCAVPFGDLADISAAITHSK
jgi:hypothetical protein